MDFSAGKYCVLLSLPSSFAPSSGNAGSVLLLGQLDGIPSGFSYSWPVEASLSLV